MAWVLLAPRSLSALKDCLKWKSFNFYTLSRVSNKTMTGSSRHQYESPIQVLSKYANINRKQLTKWVPQRYLATLTKMLNRAIRNWNGHFQRTLAKWMDAYYGDLEYHQTDYQKTFLLTFYSQKTRFWACPRHGLLHVTPKWEQQSTIRQTDRVHRSSASIFHCYCCKTMSTTIPDGICLRKPAQNCDCAAFCRGLYGSDITVQATNWLAHGQAPRLVRHALTALSSNLATSNIIVSK